MEDWTEQAAEALDRLTESGLGSPWIGTARILSATPPSSRRRHQSCTVELALAAEGFEGATTSAEVVIDTRYWPEPGTVLPARFSRALPRTIDVDWEQLRSAR
ncbi:hypothetical protein SK224_01275 [Microbacterium sp. BG28]|uniref:hypothetical protein n=1 Tax=Microbacterium sp. BG28 TaxID=3097356 RepID=UPI002A5A122F|nr:hypothetical protein [Microbacterium sp. BG28]MDY0827749.1 hypothetical protein [Microbacterium sp. BG28]